MTSINLRREEIFQIAKDMAMEKGLFKLTVRDLAKEADISIGSVYNLFSTKDNLILLLIEDYWEDSIKTLMPDDSINTNDFIENLENLYKNLLVISLKFHTDFIRDMEGLDANNGEASLRMKKYKDKIKDYIKMLIEADMDVLKTLDDHFNKNDLAEFILEQFLNLIGKRSCDLGFTKVWLNKLLKDNRN